MPEINLEDANAASRIAVPDSSAAAGFSNHYARSATNFLTQGQAVRRLIERTGAREEAKRDLPWSAERAPRSWDEPFEPVGPRFPAALIGLLVKVRVMGRLRD